MKRSEEGANGGDSCQSTIRRTTSNGCEPVARFNGIFPSSGDLGCWNERRCNAYVLVSRIDNKITSRDLAFFLGLGARRARASRHEGEHEKYRRFPRFAPGRKIDVNVQRFDLTCRYVLCDGGGKGETHDATGRKKKREIEKKKEPREAVYSTNKEHANERSRDRKIVTRGNVRSRTSA